MESENTMVETFLELVQIDSESGEEEQLIEHLRKLFENRFLAKCMIDNYGNLIVYMPAKKASAIEPILLGTHADTVKPGKGIEPVLANGVIRSKGETILGADDKAGIAEIIEALRTAHCHPPLEIVVSREEETGHLGAKSLDPALLKSRMGFVLDIDSLDGVVVGGPSNMFIDVDIVGKAAHAGMEPEKGISAIRVVSHAIGMLNEGWLDHETTFNIGVLNGGEVRNSVPETAHVEAQCRSLDHEKCLHHSELVKRVFETAALASGAVAKTKLNLAYKAMRVPEDSGVVTIAKRAVQTIGLTPRLRSIGGGSDASEYNEKGILTVVLGTGARSGHTKEEHIYVEDMRKAVRMIQEIFHITSGF